MRRHAYISADVLLVGSLSKGVFERLTSTGGALTQKKMYLLSFFTVVETI